MKKIISWLLVIICMIIIFILSDVKGTASYEMSEEGINDVLTIVTHKEEKEISNISSIINPYIRKICHIIEYLVLTLLLCNALYQNGYKYKEILIISIMICFMYACSDEIHQLYRDRTCLFTDVLFDTFGGLIGIFVVKLIHK